MSAPTRELLAHFDTLHRGLLDVPAVIQGGKDAKLIANLWRSHGDLVKELMVDFFQSDDPWIQENGYTVGMFVSQAGKLIARRAARRREAPLKPDWQAECQQLHGGRCGNVFMHTAQKARTA